jgi:signal transduction histidine kinase
MSASVASLAPLACGRAASLVYPHPMAATAIPSKPGGLALMLRWRRVRFTLILAGVFGLMIGAHRNAVPVMLFRTEFIGLGAMLSFGLFEQWPRRLPRWLARWVLQLLGVALAIPMSTMLAYALTPGTPSDKEWMGPMIGIGLLIAPWAALAALVRQKEALARHQALAFDLERSELGRQALDARLRLLQAQIAPHFLFNTLANVQALVEAGSPQASDVLRSLIAYLRAAVPRLNDPATTLGQELELVRAYLELMHMRMPDRLQFALHADDAALSLRCPPMTLLTLVENAVRHGIDPSEEGGRIDVYVQQRGDRCHLRVIDTGTGPRHKASGLGTGLSTLNERLQLAFGGDAQLRVVAQLPQGACADVDFPALRATD